MEKEALQRYFLALFVKYDLFFYLNIYLLTLNNQNKWIAQSKSHENLVLNLFLASSAEKLYYALKLTFYL